MCHLLVLAPVWAVLLCSATGIRVSPKLDFGDSNTKTINAGFRPVTENSPHHGIICTTGNCNFTKSVTDNAGGISTDVLVHVQTNVDIPTKNDTVQVIPDVPIVIGSKSTSEPTPTVYNTNPFGIVNRPVNNLLQSLQTNTFFASPLSPSAFQKPQIEDNSRFAGHANTNYGTRYYGGINGVHSQKRYFNENGHRYIQSIKNHGAVGTYNPVEFRKTYDNTWSPIKWTPNNVVYQNGQDISKSAPCVYQDPATLHSIDQSTGINGKLAPLP